MEHIKKFFDEMYLIARMSYYLLKISIRYPIAFVADFVEISMWVAAFAIAAQLFASPTTKGGSIIQYTLWGFVIFIVISDVLWTMSTGLRYEQLVGVLEQNFLAPIKEYYYPLARLFRIFIRDLPVLASVPIIFKILGGVEISITNVLLGGYLFVIILIGCIGFGFFYAGIILKSKRAAIITNMIQFTLMIFGAVFYPFKTLPKNILVISKLIPFSYYIDIFRTTLMGLKPELIQSNISLGAIELTPFTLEFLLVHIISLIFLILGSKLFRRFIIEAKREGTLHTF